MYNQSLNVVDLFPNVIVSFRLYSVLSVLRVLHIHCCKTTTTTTKTAMTNTHTIHSGRRFCCSHTISRQTTYLRVAIRIFIIIIIMSTAKNRNRQQKLKIKKNNFRVHISVHCLPMNIFSILVIVSLYCVPIYIFGNFESSECE